MKHFLRYLLFLIPLTIQAQNWEIFNSYDRYNYQASGAPLISNVLFADSFKVAGSDTIYYLNRIAQKPNYISSYDTVLKNLPQFFQKQIRRFTDGTYIFSIDSSYDGFNRDTFVIKAFASVSDNWLYDTTANITATVASQTLQILFGTTDSVKQINLSNGDSILLSKSYGIVGFPSDTLTTTGTTPIYYNLSGIETRGIGDSVINFWSIYNFDVGDVFMYTNIEDGSVYNSNIEYKYTVLSKQVFADSIKYLVRNVYYEYDWQYGGNYMPPFSSISNITITFIDSATHFANSFPNQFVPYSYNEYANTSANMGSYSLYIFDSAYNVPCKEAQYFFDVFHSDTLLYQNQGYLNSLSCAVCKGIGDKFYNATAFESAINLQLIGYTKNGTQYGTVLSDGEITGISAPNSSSPAISLYPNLTADYTYVHISNAISNGMLRLAVYDLTGRIILSQPLTANRTKIDCTNLPSAVYIWRVLDENENVMGAGKLVKQWSK